jgi:hypothetical protein
MKAAQDYLINVTARLNAQPDLIPAKLSQIVPRPDKDGLFIWNSRIQGNDAVWA